MTVDKDAALKEMARRELVRRQGGERSTLADVAMAIGSGAARGTAALVGLPGDINELMGRGIGAANDYLFGAKSPEDRAAIDAARADNSILPTTENVKQFASDATGVESLPTPQTRAGRYAHTVGEFIPGALMGPGSLVQKTLAYGVIPGLTSEYGGEVAEDFGINEGYGRVAGAVVGGGLGSLARKAIQPNAIPAARQRSINTLRREGVPVTAGQATGNKALRYAESEIGGQSAAAVIDKQAEMFTKSALHRIGESAKRAEPHVMARAYKRIGGEFDRLASRYTLRFDQQFGQDVADALTEYQAMFPPSQQAPIVKDIADDILKAIQTNPAGMAGSTYQKLRSRLGRHAATAMRRDPELGDALFDLQNSLDDAMQRSITNPADRTAWGEARRQYKDYLILEKAMAGSGEKVASGLVSPAQLKTATVGKSRRNYVQGKGDFADLARAGNELMLPMPESGTAGRLAARGIPSGLGMLAGGQIGGGDAMSMLAGAAAGAGAAKLAGGALMSRPFQSYMQNGVPYLRRALPAPSGAGKVVQGYNAMIPLRSEPRSK